MTRSVKPSSRLPLLLVSIFCAGVVTGCRAHGSTHAADRSVTATTGTIAAAATWATASHSESDVISTLRAHHLQVPIDNASVEPMRGQFGDARDDGARGHEAVDIMAPRNTPIHATDAGMIVKLFQSRPGGTTIYQLDPSVRFCYYYAHLQSYAPGLHEGQKVARGDVIGYVGTTGNAPPNAPHLHFAIFQLNADRLWWQGTPIDPYAVFAGTGTGSLGSGSGIRDRSRP
jgi:murein DD-endopeptidase MepM/ murein hydrolase activator NlpD